MEVVLLVGRLLLAAVFGVAGIAKAADLEGSRRAMIGFGIPDKLAAPLGRGLPFVEILIALALIPLNFAWAGALAALGVLSIFTVAIVVSLARGLKPDCHCFGQLHSEPVGWSTLARNFMLMGIAGLIVAGGQGNSGLGAFNWLGELKTAEYVSLILSTSAVVLVAGAVFYLHRILKQQSTVLARIDAMKKVIDEDYAEPPLERAEASGPAEGLPIGAPAPEFALQAIGGEQVNLLDLLGQDKSVLLLFVSPNCTPCKSLLPSVKNWQRDFGNQLSVALLSQGDIAGNQDWLAESGARYVLLQGDSGVAAEYEAKWTPAAVMIRPDGKIASPVTYGDEAIRALVTGAVKPVDDNRKRSLEIKSNGHKPQITIGTPHSLSDLGKLAPDFSLPDVEGKIIRTEDLRGSDTLLLFWDPKCPYCQAMFEDIRILEENPPKKSPRLVFVSSGEAADVERETARLTSLFLHDPNFDVGPLFGTNRTPSAVLIDHNGRIASPPTAGRINILALAGARKSSVPVASAV